MAIENDEQAVEKRQRAAKESRGVACGALRPTDRSVTVTIQRAIKHPVRAVAAASSERSPRSPRSPGQRPSTEAFRESRRCPDGPTRVPVAAADRPRTPATAVGPRRADPTAKRLPSRAWFVEIPEESPRATQVERSARRIRFRIVLARIRSTRGRKPARQRQDIDGGDGMFSCRPVNASPVPPGNLPRLARKTPGKRDACTLNVASPQHRTATDVASSQHSQL